jgi:hypothetical protein
MGNGPDLLHGHYMNLDQTPLTATINDGPTDLPTFDLKSK